MKEMYSQLDMFDFLAKRANMTQPECAIIGGIISKQSIKSAGACSHFFSSQKLYLAFYSNIK